MSNITRLITTGFVALFIGLPIVVHTSPNSHLLNEDPALALLQRTLNVLAHPDRVRHTKCQRAAIENPSADTKEQNKNLQLL